jgi:hypothetical protein
MSDNGAPAMRAPRAAAVAALYLRERGFDRVGWGDTHLLHEIAEVLGMKADSWRTERLVLNRIDRTNRGEFCKVFTGYPSRGLAKVRVFVLNRAKQKWRAS